MHARAAQFEERLSASRARAVVLAQTSQASVHERSAFVPRGRGGFQDEPHGRSLGFAGAALCLPSSRPRGSGAPLARRSRAVPRGSGASIPLRLYRAAASPALAFTARGRPKPPAATKTSPLFTRPCRDFRPPSSCRRFAARPAIKPGALITAPSSSISSPTATVLCNARRARFSRA